MTMADDDLVIGEAVAVGLRPAGFALRGASAAIDVIATAVVTGVAVWLEFQILPAGSDIAVPVTILLLALLLVLVPATVETTTRGKSLGRLALGLRIVRDDGGAIGFRHAFIRALTGLLEFYLTLGGTAALVGLLSPRSKRLGDLLAGTYAMHERTRQVAPLGLTMPPPLAEWARIADAARMPDPLTRRIASFLRQAPAMLPASRATLAASLAAEAARYASPLPPVPPELFLVGVAVLRRDREAAALARQATLLARLEPSLRTRRGLPER